MIKLKKFIVSFLAATTILLNVQAVEVKAEKDDILGEVKFRIMQFYNGKLPIEVFNAETMDELMGMIDDQYTSYMSAEELKEFENGIDNAFYGIGVHIKDVEEGLKIEKVMKGGPASKVGIQNEDIIIKVNDESIAGYRLEKSRSLIVGEEGTEVKITVKRGEKILSFNPLREKISSGTVTMEWLNNRETAHVIIDSFGENTYEEFYETIKRCIDAEAENYIIDLRNNLGGYMDQALNVASTIIGDNTVIVADSKTQKNENLKGDISDIRIDKPVIILVNQYSASSSEILSAAVKDYDKAYFIGKNTYGKGIAQSIVPLSDGGVLKVTSKEFFPPSRRKVHEVGIDPDMELQGINPLVVAMRIFDNAGQENALYVETEAESMGIAPDSEFEDKTLNGWKLKADLIKNEIDISSEENITIDFKVPLENNIDNLKNNITLLEGSYGREIECELKMVDGKVIIDPMETLKEDIKYILELKPQLKGSNGSKLNRGKFAIININK